MKWISYDSPVVKILNNLADIMLVNLLFLICSLPLFTIAASRCALYSVCEKWVQGKDAGVKYFWDAFCKNLKEGVVISVLQCLIPAVLTLDISLVVGSQQEFMLLKVIFSLALVLLSVASVQLNLIFFKYNCTVAQYIKNAAFISLAHPLRTIVLSILFGIPVVVAVVYPKVLFAILPVLLLFYFCLEGICAIRLMDGILDRLGKEIRTNQ